MSHNPKCRPKPWGDIEEVLRSVDLLCRRAPVVALLSIAVIPRATRTSFKVRTSLLNAVIGLNLRAVTRISHQQKKYLKLPELTKLTLKPSQKSTTDGSDLHPAPADSTQRLHPLTSADITLCYAQSGIFRALCHQLNDNKHPFSTTQSLCYYQMPSEG